MKILVYDHGLCLEAAVTLQRFGHEVYYFTPWDEAFPRTAKAMVGRGVDGVTRVDEFWTTITRKHIDMVACFDTFSKDIVKQCKRMGITVWGAGYAEELEHDRAYTKQLQKKLGLPVNEWELIVGIEPLMAYLKKHKNKWVKTNKFRGDVETFFHDEWSITIAQLLGRMLVDFGAIANEIEFIVEEPIEGVEPGVDEFVINGEYTKPYLIGYEDKDNAYLCVQTEKLPPAIKRVNDAFSLYLKDCKSLVSYEIRVDKKGNGYLIDPCIRAPHPPLAVELEIYDNFASIVTEGTLHNANIRAKTAAPYGAAIEIRSDWIDSHWTEISFPKELRSSVKLQNACCVDGHYYVLPHSFIACTVIGLGQTPQDAIAAATEAANEVKLRGKQYDNGALKKLLEEVVPEGEQHGIPF